MSIKDACPTCGELRSVIDRDRYGVTWFCDVCKGLATEEYEPDASGDLQREWERR